MNTVGIIGAGTMGAGIAQVAACAPGNSSVLLMDIDADTARSAIAGIGKRLNRLVEKGRMSSDEAAAASARLQVVTALDGFAECDLVIEAIVENLDVKATVLGGLLPSLPRDCIIATNTSSLSVTKLAEALGDPFRRRTVGMHFFNPAPLMKLVEVIAGDDSDPAVVDRVAEIASSWGKQVARAADVPGFIVNHVARPYYLEAFRILQDGIAAPDVIDSAMKDLGGFRMGPLELTDLIGQDVNTATTRSVWEQLDHPPLLAPSPLQESLVEQGHLGRKSGRGVYEHAGEMPTPALEVEAHPLVLADEAHHALDEFVSHAFPIDESPADGREVAFYVFARLLSGLIVQAHLACERGVATRADIDTALKYGVNYPRGPFEWTERIGADVCARWLGALNATVDDDRFGVPMSLMVFK